MYTTFYISSILYQNNKWQISDGDIHRESANGTWLSLTDYRIRKERSESETMEIVHNSEIKISDVILKIELMNNDRKTEQPVERNGSKRLLLSP